MCINGLPDVGVLDLHRRAPFAAHADVMEKRIELVKLQFIRAQIDRSFDESVYPKTGGTSS
jgi:hypothetical protein